MHDEDQSRCFNITNVLDVVPCTMKIKVVASTLQMYLSMVSVVRVCSCVVLKALYTSCSLHE